MAVDGWAVTFGTARRGLGGAAEQRCPLLYGFNVPIKGLSPRCNAMALRDGDVLLFVCLLVCSSVANAYRGWRGLIASDIRAAPTC